MGVGDGVGGVGWGEGGVGWGWGVGGACALQPRAVLRPGLGTLAPGRLTARATSPQCRSATPSQTANSRALCPRLPTCTACSVGGSFLISSSRLISRSSSGGLRGLLRIDGGPMFYWERAAAAAGAGFVNKDTCSHGSAPSMGPKLEGRGACSLTGSRPGARAASQAAAPSCP